MQIEINVQEIIHSLKWLFKFKNVLDKASVVITAGLLGGGSVVAYNDIQNKEQKIKSLLEENKKQKALKQANEEYKQQLESWNEELKTEVENLNNSLNETIENGKLEKQKYETKIQEDQTTKIDNFIQPLKDQMAAKEAEITALTKSVQQNNAVTSTFKPYLIALDDVIEFYRTQKDKIARSEIIAEFCKNNPFNCRE